MQPAPPRQTHWDAVYRNRDVHEVSWFRPHLQVSLRLLQRAGLSPDSRLIDIGGGASTLVDDLLDLGVKQVTVLDLSAAALAAARQRLGDRAGRVHWQVADLCDTDLPTAGFDLWHDRAVLHFLVDEGDVRRYAAQAARAVSPGGHAVIGGFAPSGPERCSGLPVARRSAADIAQILAPHFRLIEEQAERHTTPGGVSQPFVYALLQRV